MGVLDKICSAFGSSSPDRQSGSVGPSGSLEYFSRDPVTGAQHCRWTDGNWYYDNIATPRRYLWYYSDGTPRYYWDGTPRYYTNTRSRWPRSNPARQATTSRPRDSSLWVWHPSSNSWDVSPYPSRNSNSTQAARPSATSPVPPHLSPARIFPIRTSAPPQSPPRLPATPFSWNVLEPRPGPPLPYPWGRNPATTLTVQDRNPGVDPPR